MYIFFNIHKLLGFIFNTVKNAYNCPFDAIGRLWQLANRY